MTLMADGTFKSLWGSSQFTPPPFERPDELCRWRQKKRSPPDSTEDHECLSKRFASEELVTAHLQGLHISTPHHPHTPHTPTLMVTAVTDCPGYIPNDYCMTGSNGDLSRVERYPWQQTCTYREQWDNELVTRGSSSVTLVDDPSSGCSWQRGEEVCPPMYPVRAQPSGEEIWAESRVTPPTSLAANHSPASVEEEMMFDKRQTTEGAAPSRGSPTSLKRTPCSLSLPWNGWRQVTLDEVSSDSSDGGTDGPESPLSVWIAPELIQCAQLKGRSLPQSLLEKYNKPAGMEVVLWVDPNKRLKVGCEESKGEDMTETLDDQEDSDMC